MYACTPDNEADNIGPRNITQNTGDDGEEVCDNCSGELEIIKTTGPVLNPRETTLGGFEVCEENGELCFYYTASAGTIGNVRIGFWISLEDIYDDNVNPSPKHFESNTNYQHQISSNYDDPICIKLEDIATALGYESVDDLRGNRIVIATDVQLSGGDGVEGGQSWVGTLVDNSKYPFERYFEYEVCENGGNGDHCLFTQGYWFAKPNSVWPNGECGEEPQRPYTCGTVELGGETYTRSFLREVFYIKGGKSSLRQAFLQAAALQLNLDSNPQLEGQLGTECFGALAALATIETYLEENYPNGVTIYDLRGTARNATLQQAADDISSCLNSTDFCNAD